MNSRPDIAIATSLLGRKVVKPTTYDWNEAKRVVRYLKMTKDWKLFLGKDNEKHDKLIAFVHADWGGSKEDRKSNTGFVIKLSGGVISWVSRKQTCVTLSSTEAEFIALAECCQEILWFKKLLDDFGIETGTVSIYEDNQSCMKLVDQEKQSNRSKHIDIKYYFVKDLKLQGIINLIYCPTELMVADLLTKPLGSQKLSEHVKNLGIYSN